MRFLPWNRGRVPSRARRSTRAVVGLEPMAPILLLTASPAAVAPSDDEQLMLELINRARANPQAEGQRLVGLLQADPTLRAAAGSLDVSAFLQEIDSYGPRPPLAFDPRLIAAARDRDALMLAANAQEHSPSGAVVTGASGWLDSDGQPFFPADGQSWTAAENIFAYSGNVADRSTSQVVEYFEAAFLLDWGNPDFGHLKNLMLPGPSQAQAEGTLPIAEIGIGLLTGVSPTAPPPASAELASNDGLNVGPDLVTQEFAWRRGDPFLTGVAYQDRDGGGFYSPGEGLGAVTISAVGLHGEGTFSTTTWDSGGYSLKLPAGTFAVTASGGALSAPSTTTVTIGTDNVGWDIVEPKAPAIPASPVVGLPAPSPASTPTPVASTPSKTVAPSPSSSVSPPSEVGTSKRSAHPGRKKAISHRPKWSRLASLAARVRPG